MSADKRYEITRAIGTGGMAEVYEAFTETNTGFRRRVAIKRLLPAQTEKDSARSMFFDEARIASRLNHANIVSVIDYGQADGDPFLVMEFIDGLDTRDACKNIGQGRMPTPLAIHICTQVAYALSHAHLAVDESGDAMGIVHRDVSPNNVLLSWDGDVYLADFGIAIAFERETKTRTGFSKGKPAFMAPEQLLGGTTDARSDLFSLGCTLHALLVGESPLSKEHALPTLISEGHLPLDPQVPQDVAAVIDRATRYRKHERFPDAESMAEALAELLVQRERETTPRTALKRWLAPERERHASERNSTPTSNPATSVTWVASGEEAVGSSTVPQFSTQTIEGPTLPDLARQHAAPEVSKPSLRANLLFALAAIAGLGALVTWQMGAAPVESAPSQLSLPPESSVPIVDESESNDPQPSQTAPDASLQPDDPDRVQPAATRVPSNTRRAPNRAATPATAMAAPSLPRSIGMTPSAGTSTAGTPSAGTPRAGTPSTGALTIGGPGAHLANVFINGQRRGTAPTTLELPLGTHRVELRRRNDNGRWISIANRRITLDERHHRRSPQRWIVRE